MASKIKLICQSIEFLFFIGNTWLENRSFSIDTPIVSLQQQSIISTKSSPVIDVKPKEEKKPVTKPVQTSTIKKNEATKCVLDLLFFDQNY